MNLMYWLMACGQSYHDGVVALCDAPLHKEPGEEVYQTVDRTVTNSRARGLFQGMVQYDQSGIEVLREEVDSMGLPKCPIIDTTTVEEPIQLPR